MDWIEFKEKVSNFLGKYKYVLLILCIGILLMSIPDHAETATHQESIVSQEIPTSRAKELEEILAQISGVGKVSVLLTEAAGEETIFQADEDLDISNGSERRRINTVIVTDSSREERGLVRTVTPPVYLGAIIVCQGGDIPTVKLNIVQAVSSVTGISSERITVLKMK